MLAFFGFTFTQYGVDTVLRYTPMETKTKAKQLGNRKMKKPRCHSRQRSKIRGAYKIYKRRPVRSRSHLMYAHHVCGNEMNKRLFYLCSRMHSDLDPSWRTMRALVSTHELGRAQGDTI